jgi:hypothetical protein
MAYKKHRQGDDIRLSQIVGAHGVGGLRVQMGGLSMICAGLDHWYKPYTSTRPMLDIPFDRKDVIIKEKRLQKFLDVDYFMQPPEYRDNPSATNAYLPVPYFRFPKFSYCSDNRRKDGCGRIAKLSPSDGTVKALCQYCSTKANKNSILKQVNIVVACKNGHLDEFPWYEWAHKGKESLACNPKDTVYRQRAGTGVSGQIVKCLNCESSNDMASGFSQLKSIYGSCKGMRPWHGNNITEPCDEEVKGVFSNQISAYSPKIQSSLFIPIDAPTEIQEIDAEMDNNRTIKFDLNNFEQDFTSSDERSEVEKNIDKYLNRDDGRIRKALSSYSEDSIKKAWMRRIYGSDELNAEVSEPESDEEYRRQEFEVFNNEVNNKYIATEIIDIDEYSEYTTKFIDKIVLVKSILETRVLTGFNRISGDLDLSTTKKLLWKDFPTKPNRWLPAVQNYGEGIFIKFNQELLTNHGEKKEVIDRLSILEKSHENTEGGLLANTNTSTEHLFVHTLSHLLINEISFYAGYSAASMSERLYVSTDDDNKMLGLLIYTSQGDSEGTMGGLVEVGKPGIFDEIIKNSILNSAWCSTDPVCNEVIPQGPFKLNLGACYSCCLLPETSCELMNSFLDRGIVSGTQSTPGVGLLFS